MDTNLLVENQIADGETLVDRLIAAGVVVRAAFWVKPTDEDRWSLFIATPLFDQVGAIAAYQQVLQVLRTLDEAWISSSDLSLIGENHEWAQAVCDVLREYPNRRATKPGRPTLRGVDDVYIYPLSAGAVPRPKLTGEQRQLLKDLYARSSLSADELAYTDDMDRIHADFVQRTGLSMTVREVYNAIMTLRKQGRLDRKLRA